VIYEIVNPSDPYSIDGEREAVCAAVLLLGEGMYGVQAQDGERELPVLAFCPGDQPERWWREQFGRSIGDSLSALRAEMAAALATVRLGRPGDPAPRERSSLNDIGARATRLAARLRPSPPGDAARGEKETKPRSEESGS
jgi:hypothetical protein